jgi:hypothetical protein
MVDRGGDRLWSLLYGIVTIAASIELENLRRRIDDANRQFEQAFPDQRMPTAHAS